MTFKVGDRIENMSETINGKVLQGEIVFVEKNRWDMITSYFAMLDIGMYIQFKPHSLKWRKVEEITSD